MFTSVVKGTGNVGGVFTLVASVLPQVIALMCSLLLSKLEHLCGELMRPVLECDKFLVSLDNQQHCKLMDWV